MLYGKFHILHVPVMLLQGLAYFSKLFERFRELLLHLRNLHRRTDTCYNILSLCIC